MKYILIHILSLLSLVLFAQNKTTINCYAPQFKGQVASLVTYQDYITNTLVTLDKGTIDSLGRVQFHCNPKRGLKTLIQIQDKSAILYLDPLTSKYTVSFPSKIENVQKLSGNTVRLVFDSLRNDDLNTLILEFNLRLDYFLYGDTARVQSFMQQDQVFRDSLSNFTQRMFDIYKDVDCRYFKDYFKYSIASVALFSDKQNPAKNKYIVFETFIKSKAILYHNDAYVLFLKEFYKGLLSDIQMVDRDKATFAINNASSLEKLDELLRHHYYLGNSVFREFVMLNALSEAYHTTFFNRSNIQYILGLIAKNSKTEIHKTIAKNIIDVEQKLVAGSVAPDFSWLDKSNESKTLKELRGKYVYISFWASWNKPSIQEMLVIAQLKEKYSKYVNFVSISLDADPIAYKKFMHYNGTKFDWFVGHYNGDSKLLNDYNIRNVPQYILVDMEGYIMQSPALSPSPNGSYSSIDETFHNIKRKLEPKAQFNIGQK